MQRQITKWICYSVGYVFITSGILKFVVHDFREIFANLGLPFPEITLLLVAILEFSCGMLIAGRMFIKQAIPPLILIMVGAIFITKIPVISSNGFLYFAFEARLDIVMLILLFLIWKYVPSENFVDSDVENSLNL